MTVAASSHQQDFRVCLLEFRRNHLSDIDWSHCKSNQCGWNVKIFESSRHAVLPPDCRNAKPDLRVMSTQQRGKRFSPFPGIRPDFLEIP